MLALLIHPSTSHHIINRIFWAFCVYLEAVSVLPQLRVMQNTKVEYPLTHNLNVFFFVNWLVDRTSFSTARLLNHSQLIMCLPWELQGS